MRGVKWLLPLLVVLAARRAEAYPQFQFSTGAETCKECHYSPAGGGLINDYGRDEAGSTLSMKDGNGGFLHGAWTPPDAFQIGVDLRAFVCCVKQTPATGAEFVAFPMQSDLYLRPKVGDFSATITVGNLPTRTSLFGLASREHYVMYENQKGQWYARAGRFYPIYGIRSQDHTANIRRDLQMYLYEEPYGAAWGKYMDSGELHISAFVQGFDVLADVAKDNGVAVYYERRNAEATAAYAAQTKLTVSDTDRRGWLGGVYKRWMEGAKLMLLAEADAGLQMFPGGEDALYELVGYLGVTHMTKKGLMIGGSLQTFDPDLGHHGTSRDSAELDVQWLPYPHFEIHSILKSEWLGLDLPNPTVTGLIQLHYYL